MNRETLIHKIYTNTHQDYRGRGDNGEREVLTNRDGRTVVVSLDNLDDEQLLEHVRGIRCVPTPATVTS